MENDSQTMAGSDGVSVHTGFPNPALDQARNTGRLSLDINRLLIRHSESTYLFRVSGHDLADQGIYDGDVAVIDRALDARSSDLVIAWRASGSTICRRHRMEPEDQLWGVVTAVIHQYRP